MVKCLLIVPNPESALNEEAGRQLLERYDDYAKHARLMTSIHASSAGQSNFAPQMQPSGTFSIEAPSTESLLQDKEGAVDRPASEGSRDVVLSGSEISTSSLPDSTRTGPRAVVDGQPGLSSTQSSDRTALFVKAGAGAQGQAIGKRKSGPEDKHVDHDAGTGSGTQHCDMNLANLTKANIYFDPHLTLETN